MKNTLPPLWVAYIYCKQKQNFDFVCNKSLDPQAPTDFYQCNWLMLFLYISFFFVVLIIVFRYITPERFMVEVNTEDKVLIMDRYSEMIKVESKSMSLKCILDFGSTTQS